VLKKLRVAVQIRECNDKGDRIYDEIPLMFQNIRVIVEWACLDKRERLGENRKGA
jgi:hypothetical protein